jgi:hypothetical protein
VIYREIIPPTRFSSAPPGYVVMQSEIRVSVDDAEKYAVAIYPQENSPTWYFLTPNGEVWVNGLDDKSATRECICLFDTLDEAHAMLDSTLARWPRSPKGGIFKTTLDEDGGLVLCLLENLDKSQEFA